MYPFLFPTIILGERIPDAEATPWKQHQFPQNSLTQIIWYKLLIMFQNKVSQKEQIFGLAIAISPPASRSNLALFKKLFKELHNNLPTIKYSPPSQNNY